MKTALKWIMRITGILLLLFSFVEIEVKRGEEAAADADDEDIII